MLTQPRHYSKCVQPVSKVVIAVGFNAVILYPHSQTCLLVKHSDMFISEALQTECVKESYEHKGLYNSHMMLHKDMIKPHYF